MVNREIGSWLKNVYDQKGGQREKGRQEFQLFLINYTDLRYFFHSAI